MSNVRLDDDTVRRLANQIATDTGHKRPLWKQVGRAAAFAVAAFLIVFCLIAARQIFS